MLEFLRKHVILFAFLLVAYGGWHFGSTNERLKWQEEKHNDYITKVEANKRTQEALNEISKGYQEDLAQGKADAAGTVVAINQSGKRLRVKLNLTESQLRQCGLQLDGKAELHRETSEALVRITQDADKHVEALQKTVRALQGKEVKQ